MIFDLKKDYVLSIVEARWDMITNGDLTYKIEVEGKVIELQYNIGRDGSCTGILETDEDKLSDFCNDLIENTYKSYTFRDKIIDKVNVKACSDLKIIQEKFKREIKELEYKLVKTV